MRLTRETARVVTVVVLVILTGLAPVAGAAGSDLRGTASDQSETVSDGLGDGTGVIDASQGVASYTARNSAPYASDVHVWTRENTQVMGAFNAVDPDGDSLSYTVVSGPDNGTVTTDNGTFTYTPDAGYTGDDSFTYTVEDGQGGSANATVRIDIRPFRNVATGPNLYSVHASTWDRTTGAHPRKAVDGRDDTAWAGTNGTGDWLEVELERTYDVDRISVNVGDHTLTYDVLVSPDGSSWTTVADEHQTQGDNYADSESETVSNFSTDGVTAKHVRVEVESTNASARDVRQAIVESVEVYSAGQRNTYTSAENVSVSTRAGSAVSGTFYTRDGDDDTLSYSVVSEPDHGTVTTDGDSFTYTPSAGYEGRDTFTYQVSNSDGDTDTATVTVTVHDESAPETENVATTSNGASISANTWSFYDGKEGVPSNAIDGNDSTAWAGNGWIEVDLGRNYSVDEIQVNAGSNTLVYDVLVTSAWREPVIRPRVAENHITRGDNNVSTESESVSTISLDGRTVRYIRLDMESANAPPGEQYLAFIESIEVYPAETSQRQFSHRWNASHDHRFQHAEVASGGGKVFAADLGRNVTAYDDETGAVAWQFQREGSLVDSSPVASGDLVYVGSGSGILYALDQSNGSVVWTAETDSAIGSTPAVAGETVYFTANDGGLYAVDAATGDVDWQTTVDGFPSAGPVVSNGTVYVTTTDGTVVAHSTDTGEERWSREFDSELSHSGPTVADGRVVVAAGNQVYGLDTETGVTQLAVSHAATHETSVTVAGGAVYLSSASGILRAINVTTGETEWTHTAGGSIRSEVLVVDGTVMFGTNDGTVRALDAANGIEFASLSIDGQVPTSAVVTDRSMYVGTWDGRIYALDTAG